MRDARGRPDPVRVAPPVIFSAADRFVVLAYEYEHLAVRRLERLAEPGRRRKKYEAGADYLDDSTKCF